MTEWTKEKIVDLLRSNDKAVGRALLRLMANQTDEEVRMEIVKNKNNKGFRPCHARSGTGMARYFKNKGYLTEAQLAYWRRPEKSGKMRIEIYANQLLREVQKKC